MKTIIYLILFIALCFLACDSVHYDPIPGVDRKINALGKTIAKLQRSEVWTGGNEYSGCYTWDHRKEFIGKDGLRKLVEKAKKNKNFKIGVIALKKLPTDKQNEILNIWNEPIDPTWRQTGKIGKGTTDAGQLTERDIAKALTNLVREMLKLSDEEIENF